MHFIADWLNTRGMAAHDRGHRDKAIASYRRAARWDPEWSVPWYNLGLLAKYEHDWPASLAHNQQAVKIDPSNEAAWWNLGIAATALANWSEARRAWKAYGIDIPEGVR
jgi:tetratricopeptide (TPR) repeat protein